MHILMSGVAGNGVKSVIMVIEHDQA